MIGVVLDASALLAYASREISAVHVGELLKIVAENQGHVGVGTTSYVDAYRRCPDDEHRRRLFELSSDVSGVVKLLPLLDMQAQPIAELALEMPTEQAQAVFEAQTHDACLATTDPQTLKRHVAAGDLLEL